MLSAFSQRLLRAPARVIPVHVAATTARVRLYSSTAGPSAAQQALTNALKAWRVDRKRDEATLLFAEARRLASAAKDFDTSVLAHGHGAMFRAYEFDDFEAASGLLGDAVRLLKLQGGHMSPRTRLVVHWQVAQFAHRFQGSWLTAEQHYGMAQAIDSSNPLLLLDHARMYIDRGSGKADYATATTKLHGILERWPDNCDALTWLGFIFDQVRRKARGPRRADLRCCFACVGQVYRDYNQAQTYYERALSADATNLDCLRMYADFCLEARNDRHRAAELRARLEAQLARRKATSGQSSDDKHKPALG